MALQVANDILRSYNEFSHLKPEEYTWRSLQLAEIFIEWRTNSNIEDILIRFFDSIKSKVNGNA